MHDLENILAAVAQGRIAPGEAARLLSHESAAARGQGVVEMPGGLCLDSHRTRRTGQGEVIYGQGKDVRQLVNAVTGLSLSGEPVLATRVTPEMGAELLETFPTGTYDARARLFALGCVGGRDLGLAEPWPRAGELVVVTAGASDLPVALEAYGTARFFGLDAALISDVGVAGPHRVMRHVETLKAARLLIVVAGMEGALPSLAAGLTGRPILAVPTSVGYGASLGGVAALLAMLSSCATGVAVVNIDNGFGAAAMAAKILKA